MKIVSERNETIYRNDFEGKPSYSLGLSKKNKDTNEYTNGFIKVNFKKGTDLNNKTKIKIKDGWLDFYLKDKITIPTLFINEFEIVEEQVEEKKQNDPYTEMKAKVENDIGQQITIEDDELPF